VRVAFVSSHAKSGGSERYLADAMSRLPAERVHSVVALEDGPFAAETGAAVVRTGPGALDIVRSAARLRRRLRADAPDVIHANGVKAALVVALATLGTGVPFVWVKHDFSWDGVLAWAIASRARRVLAVSVAVASTFPPALRRRVRVVHTGIEHREADRKAARAELVRATGADGTRLFVGLVGRLHPVKGHAHVIEAAQRLAAEATVVFVGGDDPSTPQHAQEIREAATRAGVHVLGHRDDARELAAGLDVGVIASVPYGGAGREGFPLVGLELLDAGVPVVAYDGGGVAELLGECARIVPSGDRDGLTDALLAVVRDAELRERMRACGRARVASEFSVDAWIDALERCYREAAA
jgi:glycosyltransferase involved in cell wall biosynthesis